LDGPREFRLQRKGRLEPRLYRIGGDNDAQDLRWDALVHHSEQSVTKMPRRVGDRAAESLNAASEPVVNKTAALLAMVT
jgi:hypothetical protein